MTQKVDPFERPLDEAAHVEKPDLPGMIPGGTPGADNPDVPATPSQPPQEDTIDTAGDDHPAMTGSSPKLFPYNRRGKPGAI